MTVFGWPKTPGSGAEEGAKAFKKFGEVLKKNKCNLLFWAGSFGVPEPVMYVVQFDDIKDWENAGNELLQAMPLTNTRTIFGWEYQS